MTLAIYLSWIIPVLIYALGHGEFPTFFEWER
jgi:hypothetical protein